MNELGVLVHFYLSLKTLLDFFSMEFIIVILLMNIHLMTIQNIEKLEKDTSTLGKSI